MAILDIFDGVEADPSLFEIALQQLTLSGLQKQVEATEDFSSAVERVLGFKRGENNELIRLTEEEIFDTLPPLEQSTFKLLKAQTERLEKAFSGDLPVSEQLKQRSIDQFNVLDEELSRRGQPISGTNLETAVGFSTPAIQSIGQRQRTQGLLEDTERRNEIISGFDTLQRGTGLLSNLRTSRFSELTAAPSRFNLGTSQAGLLSNLNQQSLFNAQSQADLLSGIGGIAGKLLDPSITTAAGLLEKLIF